MGPWFFSKADPAPAPSNKAINAKPKARIDPEVQLLPQQAESANADTSAHAALIHVLEDPDRKTRETALESLGASHFRNQSGWEKQLSAITDQVDRLSYLRGVMAEWAKTDPLAALHFLAGATLGTRIELVPEIITAWARRDPQAAEKWILTATQGEVRTQATEALYRSWALAAPELAAQSSLAFSDASLRERALAGVLQEWSANDLNAVETWVSTLQESPLRSTALRAVAEEMAHRNPLEAIRWANAQLASAPGDSASIIATVAAIAGMEQPVAIMDWLVKLPPSPDAASAIAGVASYMTEADAKFSEQGYTLLPPAAREIAASSIANTLGAINPTKGQEWIKRQPQEQQPQLTEDFIRGWSVANPDSALRWANALPPSILKEAAHRGLQNSLKSTP